MAKKADKTEGAIDAKKLQDLRDLKAKIKANINKNMFVNIDENNIALERMTSGVFNLDLILGGNKNKGFGWPVGRISTVVGESHSGKTTVILSTIAEAQKAGKIIFYLDVEMALDYEFASSFGIDVMAESFTVIHPENAEEAFQTAESLANSGAVDLIIIDSIAACVPKKVKEQGYDEQTIGLAAKLFTKFTNTMLKILYDNKCTLLMINQYREKFNAGPHSDNRYTPGGKAAKYNDAVELQTKRVSKPVIDGSKEEVGTQIIATTLKNKTFRPKQTCIFSLSYKGGIMKEDAIYETALAKNVIKQGGAWFYFGELKWNGKANVIDAMVSDPNLVKQINAAIIESL